MLTLIQLRRARLEWSRGRNTVEIAEQLGISEAAIYNSLNAIKPVYSALESLPPNPFNNTVGGASNVLPIRAPAIAARRLSDAVQVAHKESSPLSVASTLRRETENCPSTRATENFREGAK